jgi:long-subunit fatty acid transport protein
VYRKALTTVAALAATTALTAAPAAATGLDRSQQSVLSVFDEPGTLGFSLSYVRPDVTGEDIAGGGRYDPAGGYSQLQVSYTGAINDRLTFTLIGDQPFGSDIFYDDAPATSGLGGTAADISSEALTALLRYQAAPRISIFGGLRLQNASGRVALNGRAYAQALSVRTVAAAAGTDSATLGAALQGSPEAVAALGGPSAVQVLGGQVQQLGGEFLAGGGYSVEIDESWGAGVTLGGAYEIPEIALRLAVTYHSEIDHEGDSIERFGFAAAGSGAPIAGTTEFTTPQSVNVDFQTGIASDTLLLAGIRWAEWGAFDVIPPTLNTDLATTDAEWRYSLGVGRRFSEAFSGLATITYEPAQDNDNTSPLAPSDGLIGLSVGGSYEDEGLTVSGGVGYTVVGDVDAGVAGQDVASFDDNDVWGVGLRVAYEF